MDSNTGFEPLLNNVENNEANDENIDDEVFHDSESFEVISVIEFCFESVAKFYFDFFCIAFWLTLYYRFL